MCFLVPFKLSYHCFWVCQRTKGRSTKSKGATKKKTKTPLKKADEAHKRAQEEKEKTVKREIAREERNERYERRRASAEERQRVQAQVSSNSGETKFLSIAHTCLSPLQTAGTARSTPEERQPEASSPRPVSARDKGKGREVPTDDQGNASRQEGQAAAPVAASTCTSTSTSAFTSTSIFNSTSTSAPAPTFQGSVFGAETMARLAREEAPVPAPAPVQPGIQMSDATKARCIAMYRRKHGENTLQTEEEQQIVLAEIARRLYS